MRVVQHKRSWAPLPNVPFPFPFPPLAPFSLALS